MIVFSCNEPVSLDELDASVEKSLKDEAFSQLAINLASSFENTNVKSFIKNKSLELIDGDYNFLVAMNHNKTIKSSNANSRSKSLLFSEVLAGKKSSASNSRVLDDSFIENLLKEFPLLQVAVPELESVSVENWNVEHEDPLVAYVPETIIDDKIEAYDKEGNVHYLSASEEPDRLVIVISENERIMALPKATGARLSCGSELTTIHEDESHSYVLREDYFEAQNECTLIDMGYPIAGGSGTSGSNEENCDRDNNNDKDRLNKLIFNSIDDFKEVNEWFDGGQDIEAKITFANANGNVGTVTKTFNGKDNQFRKCKFLGKCSPIWFDLGGVEIVTWDKATYGTAMLYFWYEVDGGDQIEIKTGYSTEFEVEDGDETRTDTQNVEVTFTIQKKDDKMGESVVEYCNNTDGDGELYNTGMIKFYVNQ